MLGRGFMDGWTTLWASWVVEQALPSTTGAGRLLRRVSPFIAVPSFLVNQTSI